MTVKLLSEQYLEFLRLQGGCTGSSESTLVKMPHCWKSHVAAQLFISLKIDYVFPNSTDYDGMPHYVIYHQGLLLFDKVHVKCFLVFKGLNGLLTMTLYTSI